MDRYDEDTELRFWAINSIPKKRKMDIPLGHILGTDRCKLQMKVKDAKKRGFVLLMGQSIDSIESAYPELAKFARKNGWNALPDYSEKFELVEKKRYDKTGSSI